MVARLSSAFSVPITTFMWVLVGLTSVLVHHSGADATDEPHTKAPHPIPRKDDRSASYDIDSSTWAWIPALIIGLFTGLMLMSVKSKRFFQGKSMRLWLMRFVSIETLYNTLNGADAHEWKEQYDIEIGHQVFMAFGTLLLIGNVFFNPNADKRYVMAVLTYLQIFCLVFNTALDMFLIKAMGRVDVVRSVNTKLRFSHCIYQVILFCTDFIGGSLHLPVDCFVWATVHYTYEAVGLAIEGLNVIGMSEFAIIAIVNAQILGTVVASTGWTCAFGMSCLFLSVVSLIGGQCFKWREALCRPKKPPREEEDKSGDHHPKPHGHDRQRHSLSHRSANTLRSSDVSEEMRASLLPDSLPTLRVSSDGSSDRETTEMICEPLMTTPSTQPST